MELIEVRKDEKNNLIIVNGYHRVEVLTRLIEKVPTKKEVKNNEV